MRVEFLLNQELIVVSVGPLLSASFGKMVTYAVKHMPETLRW